MLCELFSTKMIAYVCLLVATIMRHLLLSDTQVSVKYGVASN